MTGDPHALAGAFEAQRPHLRAVAYRMLGSHAEAEDAVQEAWLRLARADADEPDDLRAWLTTVVSRVCLDWLRRRRVRREQLVGAQMPESVVLLDDEPGPEHEAILADSAGLALLVVLDALSPAERLAFVLHDVFAVEFDEIARILERTPAAARKLASRARARVQGAAPGTTADVARERRVVDALLAAARDGDFERLAHVLAPDVVLRAVLDGGDHIEVQGREAVAGRALTFRRNAASGRRALVDGVPGLVAMPGGEPVAVMRFTVGEDDTIAEIDVFADRARLAELRLG